MPLEILYQDDQFVAINKPHGLLVHRTNIARDASEFALQLLRDQIGLPVYPCHRLDRKTSGVLLFALDEKSNSLMQQEFSSGNVHKKYRTIVRGYTEGKGTIDYPLRREDGVLQDSISHYTTLKQSELNIPLLKQSTSRYSLVEVIPETGRMHQIRRHFAHIRHPIIGDRPHGCNKQNKLFKERWNMTTMMLHAVSLEFNHPILGEKKTILASPSEEFLRTLGILGLA